MLLLSLALALLSAPDGRLVLKGLDPVELTEGNELAGDPDLVIDLDGFRYRFANAKNRAKFEADPKRFEIQFGGSCARMGPMSSVCKMDQFAVHDGRIYVFASADCRKGFLADPERHLDVVEEPLKADDAAKARGRELIDLALRGMGGAAKVDAVHVLKREKSGPQESGGKTYAVRETSLWRFPDGIRTEDAWDDWVYTRVATESDAFQGSSAPGSISPTGLDEFHRQMGREPLWILRHRTAADFELAAAGKDKVGDVEAQILRVRRRGSITDLYLDPKSGRILRTAWKGRLDLGLRGEIVVDHSDFRDVGGLSLAHAWETRFDGEVAADRSGAFTKVEIDPELPTGAFEREG